MRARQVGRSFAIRKFGKAEFGTYFEADLALDTDARETLLGEHNVTDFKPAVAY